MGFWFICFLSHHEPEVVLYRTNSSVQASRGVNCLSWGPQRMVAFTLFETIFPTVTWIGRKA
jgi:hypothetical protein